MAIPAKKPRTSKKNPRPPLSDAQQAAKTVLRPVRIFVEHAIGGRTRSTLLVPACRKRKADFEDEAIGICAGRWNLILSY